MTNKGLQTDSPKMEPATLPVLESEMSHSSHISHSLVECDVSMTFK